ncbi:hypothetical protein BG46_15615 [Brucella anthropi]|uniref:hypothetical protein n=1 Tax=Brucella anthropi TaxID=529 RepID=UPI000452A97D|nr:hypothetical protein [Brucella anthropi]EXL06541.1 hypothetical protein BG46_15615 [Brucella anthropi]
MGQALLKYDPAPEVSGASLKSLKPDYSNFRKVELDDDHAGYLGGAGSWVLYDPSYQFPNVGDTIVTYTNKSRRFLVMKVVQKNGDWYTQWLDSGRLYGPMSYELLAKHTQGLVHSVWTPVR